MIERHRLKAYFLLLLVTIIWGLAGPIIKFTLEGLSPLPFLTYRFALSSLAAVILLPIAKFQLPKSFSDLFYLLIYAFLTSTVSLGFLFFGLEKTTVIDQTLITAIAPLLIGLSGVLFLNEHITHREKIGMGIAFFGTLITFLEPLLNSKDGGEQLSGNIYVVLYLLAATLSTLLVKKLLRKNISPLTLTNISFIVGFITLLPSIFVFYKDTPQILMNLPLKYHLGVIFMAFISGNLAYTLWSKGQKTIEVGEAALFSYLYPVISIPLAVLWLKEKVTFLYILGSVFIIIGVVMAEFKKRR